MTRIAILTRPDYKSPRVLAQSLKLQLNKAGVVADIFYSIDTLTRLHNYWETSSDIKFHFWLRRKLKNYLHDLKLLKELRTYDAVIISECSPNGFWKQLYHVEKFRKLLDKPVLFYEVYYLGNTPTQIATLRERGDALLERYDWHLSVADVTEIRSNEAGPWSCIGLDLTESDLKPSPKIEFIALVDFKQPGDERYREEQINLLKELNINTIVLSGKYTYEEIKALYRQASVFFMQSSEAFGLPIAECLACGVQIFTPSSAWPMAWRQDPNPQIHGPGMLPDVFCIYSSKADLKQKLMSARDNYDLEQTPIKIFNSFTHHYPHYFYGNIAELKRVLEKVNNHLFV